MLRNYIKVAFRGILKNKLYTLTNLIGLSSAMMGFIIVVVYVNYELSFDKFHNEVEDIYVLRMKFTKEMGGFYNNMVPAVTATAAMEQIPEVEIATATSTGLGNIKVINALGEEIAEKYYQWESSFFDLFSFSAAYGELRTALDAPDGVVISKQTALKYFGRENVVGEQLKLSRGVFQIRAVLNDFPANSQFQPHLVVPLKATTSPERLSSWGMNSYFVYIKLKDGGEPALVAPKIEALYANNQPEGAMYSGEVQLFPFQDSYWEWSASGASLNHRMKSLGADKNVMVICSALAFVLLFIALANYVNMATSMALKRGKEVGVRKVHGASPAQLRLQQLTETIIFCLVSLVLALVGAEVLLPSVSELMGLDLQISYLEPVHLLLLFGYTLCCGLLASAYPAFFISRMKPNVVLGLKGASVQGKKWIFKLLLGFQFALCALLVMAMVVMNGQIRHYGQFDLGFSREGVMAINIPAKAEEQASLFYDKLNSLPEVAGITYAPLPAGAAGFITVSHEDKRKKYVPNFTTDESFIETLDVTLVAGENFSPQKPSHFQNGILVNEALVKALALDNPVGKTMQLDGYNMEKVPVQIIGVISDLHLMGPSRKVQPLFIQASRDQFSARHNFIVKLNGGESASALAAIGKAYTASFDDAAMSFEFLDDAYAKNYHRIQRITTMISGTTAFIILISLFGLFSMVAFTISNRTKEIGIRKVFGVTFFSLQWTLSRSFIYIITVALLVAIPLAYWMMNEALGSFYNAMPLTWLQALLTAGIIYLFTFGIALLKGISTAHMNPVDILRNH